MSITCVTAKWCNSCTVQTHCKNQNNTSDLNQHAHLNRLHWHGISIYARFIKYIRVMPLGGQCYEEGPFFPTTPRYAVQVGIAKKQDLLLKPDWTAVFGVITGLLTLLITCVVLTVSNRHKQQPKKIILKRILQDLAQQTSHKELSIIDKFLQSSFMWLSVFHCLFRHKSPRPQHFWDRMCYFIINKWNGPSDCKSPEQPFFCIFSVSWNQQAFSATRLLK